MNGKNAWAPVFDADRRAVSFGTDLSVLENVGAQLNAYGLHEGVIVNKTAGCFTNSKKSARLKQYFSSVLSEISAMPECTQSISYKIFSTEYAGHAKDLTQSVVAQLIAQGGLKAGKLFKVQMADFNADGSAKMVPQLNDKGEVVVNADGSVVNVRATRSADYPTIPDPVIG